MAHARQQYARAIQIEAHRASRENPRFAASKLSGNKDRYKIKLRSIGDRLAYEVRDAEVIVIVVAVGKRERNAVYKAAVARS